MALGLTPERTPVNDHVTLSTHYAAVATEAALRAGAIQKAKYGQVIEIRHKGEIDLQTEVDRACEAAILETIRSYFPDHDIVAEETDLARRGSRFLWFVDPLDGTTNFAHAYPFFCSSIALAIDGEVVAGAVYDPIKEELFTGERGAGSHLNGRRLRSRPSSSLINSLLLTGFPYDLRADLAGHAAPLQPADGPRARDPARRGRGPRPRLRGRGPGRRLLGRAPPHLGRPRRPALHRGGGGRTSRFDGSAVGLTADEVLATNGRIHDALLEVLAPVEARRGAAAAQLEAQASWPRARAATAAFISRSTHRQRFVG